MKNIKDRVIVLSNYIIKTNKTIREIAREYGLSKSTVHKDLSDRLKKTDLKQYAIVKKILQNHNDIKHINGGISTKLKYRKLL